MQFVIFVIILFYFLFRIEHEKSLWYQLASVTFASSTIQKVLKEVFNLYQILCRHLNLFSARGAETN